jgi:hypothetical protein
MLFARDAVDETEMLIPSSSSLSVSITRRRSPDELSGGGTPAKGGECKRKRVI